LDLFILPPPLLFRGRWRRWQNPDKDFRKSYTRCNFPGGQPGL